MAPDSRSQASLVEALQAELHRQLLPAESSAGCDFLLDRCFRQLPEQTLAELPLEDGARAVRSLWRLGSRRHPGEILLRVARPELETDGWESSNTAIDVVTDDMAFLLATITGELDRRGLHIDRVFHPVISILRDSAGEIETLGSGEPESWIHIEVSDVAHPEELADDLRTLLEQVRLVVDDWPGMRSRVQALASEIEQRHGGASEEEVREIQEFLEWVADDHFTLLACQRHHLIGEGQEVNLQVDQDSLLGLSRIEEMRRRRPYTAAFLAGKRLLTVYKSSRNSRVHRQVHMDAISLRRFDDQGKVVGEERVFGLFTSGVYTTRTESIPFLRDKVRRVKEKAAFVRGSHDEKLLNHILETYPRDELFQISDGDLHRIALGILEVRLYRSPSVFLRKDNFERFVSCLVYLPRDRYRTELRKKIIRILEDAFEGTVTAFYVQLGETIMARIHLIVRTVPGAVPDVDVRALRAQVEKAARSWNEDLCNELRIARGGRAGTRCAATWEPAFPATYREIVKAEEALEDIKVLESMFESERTFEARLFRRPEDGEGRVRLDLYHRHRPLALSDILPILENLGLWVESGMPFEIQPEGKGICWLYQFIAESRQSEALLPEEIGEAFEEALRRVWAGELENGNLNQLVLKGAGWEQVVLLRAYSRYLQQIEVTFSQRYMADTLIRNGALARGLLDLFEVRFDPAIEQDREVLAAKLRGQIDHAFEEVGSLDDDRIVRYFLALVEATLRTNFYQRAESGNRKPYLSIKLDCSRIPILPKPRPRFEIFVYSPRFEGVHLRGGHVARGGIRWSDRVEDFRTEILGLMKAQQVKNAVIVPVGAKGGFVLKNAPTEGGRDAFIAEGVACYQEFIRGLLDLTDNLVEGRISPPIDVHRRDDDDPYLVVAADKGTATFSDIANGVAAEYDFWLGDAFASGGSVGYDHKKMGITARGAWEAVKRHFRELGLDIQSETFTVVGVGDMSGDVFGNGMLLSRKTRLVGAFNHLHIFVDPDPDPETGWQERRRLFELPRSSWSDYDRDKISIGGGIFERSARSVPVSPEMRDLLGIEEDRTTPNELIQKLLTARVDLLFFGGIGTFVKNRAERDRDAGDRANDAVRVDGVQLRCRVIGEGANLGVTQRGRIEFALAGGKVNTDAIDNSGGVDCSDHEVNIKIALRHAETEAGLSRQERDSLLESMSDEVADLVLRDNYLQTLAISLAEERHLELYDQHLRMMRSLERDGRLDRQVENLPSDEDLEERAKKGQGLTRPEFSVLLAYAKNTLYEELLRSDLPDDPMLVQDLLRYFPRPLRERFGPSIENHRLRREIISTFVTNSMVNRVGPSFVYRVQLATGRSARDVAIAYAITREAFDLREVWQRVEALDNVVPAAMQNRLLMDAALLAEHVTRWFLRYYHGPLEMSAVELFRPLLDQLASSLATLVSETLREELEARAAELESEQIPEELARRVASFRFLSSATDIVHTSLELDATVESVARVHFRLGEDLGLDWLRAAAEGMRYETPWQRMSHAVYRDGLLAFHATLVQQVVIETAPGSDWQQALSAWRKSRKDDIDRYMALLEELRAASELDLSMLTVADYQLRQLLR